MFPPTCWTHSCHWSPPVCGTVGGVGVLVVTGTRLKGLLLWSDERGGGLGLVSSTSSTTHPHSPFTIGGSWSLRAQGRDQEVDPFHLLTSPTPCCHTPQIPFPHPAMGSLTAKGETKRSAISACSPAPPLPPVTLYVWDNWWGGSLGLASIPCHPPQVPIHHW